jgi:thiol-disulfide isomerase/thioredoxin
MFKLLISFILIYTLIGCTKISNSENKPVNSQETNDLGIGNNKAPEFSLPSTDGKIVRLSDYKGKVVILDFWATWCGPCRKGIPDLIEIQKEFGKDVVVIGISLDDRTKKDVVPYMKKVGINYPVAYGTLEVTELYGGVEGIPTSFVINRKGEIVDKHVGLIPKSEFIDQINKLLKKS